MITTKNALRLLAMAAAMSACSSADDPMTAGTDAQEPQAVAFDVYTRGTQHTRAGYPGDIDENAFRVTGFGVFAYVANEYTPTGLKPTFMANQHVTYTSANGGGWTYSPVKYWPNQADLAGAGVDDLGSGTAVNAGTGIDRVSFFAYAPYVESGELFNSLADAQTDAAKPDEEIIKDGITYITGKAESGDPKVVYRMSPDPTNGVDLMYGVAATDYSARDRSTGMDEKTVYEGKPFIDMTKMSTTDKMSYRFRHALTKLFVTVDGYFDEVRNGSTPGTNDVDPNTRIVIESVTVTSPALATWGTLNLNNSVANTPEWTAGAAISAFSMPVTPGLRHVEGNTGSVAYFGQQPLGVTKTSQPLFGYTSDGATPAGLMFVPIGSAGSKTLEVTITYDVITRDANLKNGYSARQNKVKQTIDTGAEGLAAGKAYTLKLHLGMTTAKFDGDVTDWETGSTADTDLPANNARYISGVSFAASTRAGFVGDMGASNIRTTGFGVFGYQDEALWASSHATSTPDFMYNQWVEYQNLSNVWSYSPTKNWPNGAAENDYVSFFAYAPYVASPGGTSGITAISANSATDAPRITYSTNTADPKSSVDLMYGVAAGSYPGSGGAPGVSAGMPFLDITKLTCGGQLNFRFCHALTALTATIDMTSTSDINWSNTKVVIDNVELGSTGQQLYTSGVLSLQNTVATTPNWVSVDNPVGSLSAALPNELKRAAVDESSADYYYNQPLGVTTTAKSLFGKALDGTTDAQLLYIAGTPDADPITLTVTYRIIKLNPSMANGYEETTVTTPFSISGVTFRPGETTILRLHLDYDTSGININPWVEVVQALSTATWL